VVQRFTWRAVAEQTVAWYRTALGEAEPDAVPASSPTARDRETSPC
jgi:hypothetical protein